MGEISSDYSCHRLRRLHDEHKSAVVRSARVHGVLLGAHRCKAVLLFARLSATRTGFTELPSVVGRTRARVAIRRAAVVADDVLAKLARPVGWTVAEAVACIEAAVLALQACSR